MHLFRHKETGLLCEVEVILKDIRYTDRGARTGVVAYPYKHTGEKLTHLRGSEKNYNPDKYINDNFKSVAEL